jgi:hypothetical protein
MEIGRHTQYLNITIENDSIKQTNEFKYLGTVFSEDGKIDKEIDQILGQLTPLLQHRTIPMITKKHLIQSIFIPTLCYQCQTWTLTKKQKNKPVKQRCDV